MYVIKAGPFNGLKRGYAAPPLPFSTEDRMASRLDDNRHLNLVDVVLFNAWKMSPLYVRGSHELARRPIIGVSKRKASSVAKFQIAPPAARG
jgi:hypothetical protein